ncbi:MAG: hypothetical protein AB1813_26915, partial [Verrucomicrobiota bacterium]
VPADVGIFSGFGRVVLFAGGTVYDILLPSGQVNNLGAMPRPEWVTAEGGGGVWGVAEFFQDRLYLVYRRGSSIVRGRVPDGLESSVATFNNLGEMASFTVSPQTGRWYFHYEGSAEFGGGGETLGYADASFDLSARIAKGGSWRTGALSFLRCAARVLAPPARVDSSYGLRTVSTRP